MKLTRNKKNKKTSMLLLIITLVVLIFLTYQGYYFTKYIQKINEFKKLVESEHPKGDNIPWEMDYSILIDTYIHKDLYKMYSYLIAGVQDSHTTFEVFFQEYNSPDIKISCYNEKIYIKAFGEAYNNLNIGDEIIKINGKNVNNIISKISKYIAADNKYIMNYYISKLLFTDVYFDFINLKHNKCTITIQNSNGEIKDIE